jgi:phosphoribosylamine--glycine ligase
VTSVLLVDHSGRGHAFADLFVRTHPEVVVFYAPGCAAIDHPRIVSVPGLSLDDAEAAAEFAGAEGVDFAFVANANALADGTVDVLRARGIATIGPDRAAARLESSKSYTKDLCARHGIPVAEYAWFDDVEPARDYVASRPGGVVVKADGLCGGNGSFVCDTMEEASAALDVLMVERKFGAAGDRVVVEDKLDGTELLFFALTDGIEYRLLPMAADYPWSDDGNTGIVCGGMGAFGPHPHDTPEVRELFSTTILGPLLTAIRQEGLVYTGVIYVGCMLGGDGLRLLEVNVRMGEPEAEVILPRVRADFVAICRSILERRLDRDLALDLDDRHYCNVVATQGPTRQVARGRNKGWYRGWPYGRHGRNYPITGIDAVDPERCMVFLGQASVDPVKGLVTDGGRCVHVVGLGPTRADAVAAAYDNLRRIHFDGIRYRTDIGVVMPWELPARELPGVAAS